MAEESKIILYMRLMRLDKPIGIFLLLWPTLMALWIASQGQPNPFILAIFVMGAIIMRSAGCVINDICDQDFDKTVARTKNRPLAIGALNAKESLLLFIFLLFLALLLALQLNFLTVKLSVIALFLAVLYPLMKRYTYLPQVILGAAFGWAVPMAFTAITHHISKEAWWLYLIAIIWAVIYDTQYAMVDKTDDLRIGVKSTAILFGNKDRVVIGMLQLIMLLLLIKLGQDLERGVIYLGGVFAAAFLSLYQQYLIKDRDPKGCFTAFLNNNILGACLFMSLALDYLITS